MSTKWVDCGGAHETSGIPAPLCLNGWMVRGFMRWVGGCMVVGWVVGGFIGWVGDSGVGGWRFHGVGGWLEGSWGGWVCGSVGGAGEVAGWRACQVGVLGMGMTGG